MSSEGPNNGGTFADDASIGTKVWSNPGYAETSNDDRATVSADYGGNDISHYLKATNFGFSIPTGATINGIKVEIEKSEHVAAANIFDESIKLVVGGSITGDDKADATEWGTSDAYATYGGESDTWGLSPTAAQINSSDFGAVIAANMPVGFGQARVDHIRITVYYTEVARRVFVTKST